MNELAFCYINAFDRLLKTPRVFPILISGIYKHLITLEGVRIDQTTIKWETLQSRIASNHTVNSSHWLTLRKCTFVLRLTRGQ